MALRYKPAPVGIIVCLLQLNLRPQSTLGTFVACYLALVASFILAIMRSLFDQVFFNAQASERALKLCFYFIRLYRPNGP